MHKDGLTKKNRAGTDLKLSTKATRLFSLPCVQKQFTSEHRKRYWTAVTSTLGPITDSSVSNVFDIELSNLL